MIGNGNPDPFHNIKPLLYFRLILSPNCNFQINVNWLIVAINGPETE